MQFRVIVLRDPQTNAATNPQTHRQNRLQYTAPLSLARSVIKHDRVYTATSLLMKSKAALLYEKLNAKYATHRLRKSSNISEQWVTATAQQLCSWQLAYRKQSLSLKVASAVARRRLVVRNRHVVQLSLLLSPSWPKLVAIMSSNFCRPFRAVGL